MIEFFTSEFHEMINLIEGIDPLYIYLFLLAIAFTENILPPIPGDTFTIIGGYLVATGKLTLATTLLTIISGSVASIMLIYYFGYKGGREFFIRRDYRLFSAADVERVDGWFSKYGAGLLLASRFIVGARSAVAVAAGISKYPPFRMFLFSTISSIIFHGSLVALAFLMHAYIDQVSEGFDIYSKIILVLVSILIIIWIIHVLRRFRDGGKKS